MFTINSKNNHHIISEKMKGKRVLGLWLILLMLIMTACGSNQDVALGTTQGFEGNVQASGSEVQESELISQENDSEIQKSEAEAEETEPEKQDDTSKAQGESDVQEAESEVQEQLPLEEAQEDTTNDNLPTYGNYYYDVANVVLYLEVYDELPPNYITKSEAQALGWEGGSVGKYKEGAAIGGDYFGNREGLLPTADGRSYTECDIDTHGYSSRGSRRLVFSNDGLYFYTSNHYESFSEVTVTENYEVVW